MRRKINFLAHTYDDDDDDEGRYSGWNNIDFGIFSQVLHCAENNKRRSFCVILFAKASKRISNRKVFEFNLNFSTSLFFHSLLMEKVFMVKSI